MIMFIGFVYWFLSPSSQYLFHLCFIKKLPHTLVLSLERSPIPAPKKGCRVTRPNNWFDRSSPSITPLPQIFFRKNVPFPSPGISDIVSQRRQSPPSRILILSNPSLSGCTASCRAVCCSRASDPPSVDTTTPRSLSLSPPPRPSCSSRRTRVRA